MDEQQKEMREHMKDTINKDSGFTTTSAEQNSIDKNVPEYRLYPVRWAICIFFTTSIVASGLGMVGFSAITPIISDIYGVSGIITSMLVLPFIILFIPFIFPANYLIEAVGINVPVYIASVTLLVGAWIRMFVNTNFYFVLGGQIIMAIGQPFMLSAPAKLAAVWFGDNERAIATTLGSLAAPIGAVTGFLLPLPLISENDSPPESSIEHGKNKFFWYVLVQNIIITVLGLPIIFLIRNAPPTPPSKSAAKIATAPRSGQCGNIIKLLKDFDYVMLLLSFSFIYSIYTTLGAAVGPLSENFGYRSSTNSLFGTVYIFGGLAGSFVHAILLDKYSMYKLQYMVIGFACIASMGAITGVIGLGSVALSSVVLTFLGISQLPIIGVAYSFCAELTYPVNEALSCGVLQMVGSIVASILTFVITYLLDNHHKYIACYVMIGSVTLGTVFQFFLRQRLRRSRAGLKSGSFSFHYGNTNFNAQGEQGKIIDTYDANRDESNKKPVATAAPLLD